MKIRQAWIFYGINNETTIIHNIKVCKDPERTKEHKSLMRHLDNYVYERVGVITADAWNKDNQFVKFNADINLK